MIQRPTQSDIEEINSFKCDVSNQEYLKYYEIAYLEPSKLYENEWCDLQRVSKDSEGNILGFMFCGINRAHSRVDNIELLNMTGKPNIILTKDILQFFDDLLNKYNHRKICFDVVVGNPAEKIYDKIVKKYNGEISGVQKEHVRLYDNKFYDLKLYEVINERRNN